MAAARQNPGLHNLDSDLKLNKPQLKVDDRPREGGRCSASTSTRSAGRRDHAGRPAGHPLQARTASSTTSSCRSGDVDRTKPDDLREIYRPRPRRARWSSSPTWCASRRRWRRRSSTTSTSCARPRITATLAPGYSIGEALAFLDRGRQACLPAGVSTDYRRPESREFRSLDQRPLRHLPAGAGLHLSGAGGPVRELHRSRSSSC